MTYTVAQVEDAIRQYERGAEESYSYDGDFYENIMWNRDPIRLDVLGEEAVMVEREGGSEGDGDYMHVVFKVGDQLFMKEGYYNSWDSNDWDGSLEEVEPYEVTVTKYRSKQ